MRDVIGGIAAICDEIEAAFTFLAEAYPELLREIGKSREYSEDFLAQFEEGGGSVGAGNGARLREVLRDVMELMDGGFAGFADFERDGVETLAALKAGIDDAARLKDVIEGIIDMSGGLEVISLNSMIHALKVGSAGGGFSYIAGEMSKRTDATIALAKELDGDEEALLALSRGFYAKADELGHLMSRLTGEVAGEFRNRIGGLRTVTRRVLDALSEISSRSLDVKRPLFALMESIQNQDLIRQSMDQVVQIVRSLPEVEENTQSASDELLDSLAFSEQVLRIGESITDDVIRMTRESAEFLGERIGEIESTVEGLKDESGNLDERFLSEKPERPGEVTRTLAGLGRSRDDFDEILLSIAESVEEVVGSGLGIVARVDDVRKAADSMVETIEGFWNIVIAARMESVKQAALGSLSQTVDEMDSLVGKIRESAQLTADTASEIQETIKPALADHERMMKDLSESVSGVRDSLLSAHGRLLDAATDVSAGFRGFSVFSDAFLDMFEKSRGLTGGLRMLADRLEEERRALTKMRGEVSGRKSASLEARGLDEWVLRGDGLRNLIEGFTIFANKKTAQELTGAAIEVDHSDEGEITLF